MVLAGSLKAMMRLLDYTHSIHFGDGKVRPYDLHRTFFRIEKLPNKRRELETIYGNAKHGNVTHGNITRETSRRPSVLQRFSFHSRASSTGSDPKEVLYLEQEFASPRTAAKNQIGMVAVTLSDRSQKRRLSNKESIYLDKTSRMSISSGNVFDLQVNEIEMEAGQSQENDEEEAEKDFETAETFTDRQVAQALEAVDAVRKRNESEVKVFQLQVAAAELDAEEEEERLEEEKRALEADREDIAKICHEEAVNLELELQNTIEVTAKLEQIADETEDESKREIYSSRCK